MTRKLAISLGTYSDKGVKADNDDYLSFEELLDGITRFFDFKTFLSLKDIYEMMEFYFLQE